MNTASPTIPERSDASSRSEAGHAPRRGVGVLEWPDAAAMRHHIEQACAGDRCIARLVGGALLSDLSLLENLYLESALSAGTPPGWLWGELSDLFEAAGCPIAGDWAALRPGEASVVSLLQARVGRALAADPDTLLIEASAWPDDLLAPERFTRAFLHRYPWRGLVWLTADQERARDLRARLAVAT